ncbi:hypothetical protein GCM10010279_35660 [Streptomyces mutabilis]|nr:hypothetical protein GCM10010279_35660 [Streptomyces mutabilis]
MEGRDKRSEMLDRVREMADSWPAFAVEDLSANAHCPRIAVELPQYGQFAEDEHGEVVAHGHSVPFALHTEGRGTLPARGWAEVLVWAFSDLRRGVRPDTVSAVTVAPHDQGLGLSGRMLAAMRDNARALGFREVVAPVRPSAKHLEPHAPIEEYARRLRPDGLPHDPWLRVHARAGATVDSVAPASMTVWRLAGPVAELDGPALRHRRGRRGPGRPGAGALRTGRRVRGVRRAQRVDAAPAVTARGEGVQDGCRTCRHRRAARRAPAPVLRRRVRSSRPGR